MAIQALSAQRFNNFRDRFYKEVTKSPVTALLRFYTVNSIGAFTDITGDSDREYEQISVKCLYDREMTEFKRSKYGLEQDVSGLLFVSPIHFSQATPDYKKWIENFNKIRVVLYAGEYQVSLIRLKEPLYGSFICAELHLKDLHEGVE